jgi:DNA-binding transcriptional LysR family regulator
MTDRLQELQVFVRAAESGSFSRAARELGLTQPSVSRILSALEKRLGVQLLLRTTRQVTLTEAGAAFLDRARQIQADLDEAEHAARGVDSLQGTVRLAVPILYGTVRVIPHLSALLDLHPGLKIDLTVADHFQDLIAEGADIAIRIGKLADSSMGGRLLESLQRIVVAAPSYLTQRGRPHTPPDLAAHDCILGPGAFGGGDAWTFTRDRTALSVQVRGRMRTQSGPGVLSSARAGLGLAITSRIAADEAIRQGELIRVLEDYSLEPVAVNAVFPAGPRPSPKVRAVVEFLAQRIAATVST